MKKTGKKIFKYLKQFPTIGYITLIVVLILCFGLAHFFDEYNAEAFIAGLAIFGGVIAFFVIELKNSESACKQLTIQEYHRIADKDGALQWLYHMSESEFQDVLNLVQNPDDDENRRDKLRDKEDEDFLKIEDELGQLDEFAAGINSELYDYSIFKTLAFNYCRKRVTPRLREILKRYKDSSYCNLRALVATMFVEDLEQRKEKEIERDTARNKALEYIKDM